MNHGLLRLPHILPILICLPSLFKASTKSDNSDGVIMILSVNVCCVDKAGMVEKALECSQVTTLSISPRDIVYPEWDTWSFDENDFTVYIQT
jgi:hypothetical protein